MEICFWGEIKKKKGGRGGGRKGKEKKQKKEKKKEKKGERKERKRRGEGRHTFGYAIATSKIVFAKKSGFMRSYILKVIDTGTAIRVTRKFYKISRKLITAFHASFQSNLSSCCHYPIFPLYVNVG